MLYMSDRFSSRIYPTPIVSNLWSSPRYKGWKATAQDYLLYEHARNEYLRSERGRIALCAGGILWRLAAETLPVRLTVMEEQVPYGQETPVVLTQADGVVKRMTCINDMLTESEIDFIVGTYAAYTRE